MILRNLNRYPDAVVAMTASSIAKIWGIKNRH
jgi:hypothetical protein